MATHAGTYEERPSVRREGALADPRYQGFVLLWIIFAAAPIIAGADKFFGILTNWERYLAPQFPDLLGVSPHTFMLGVGVIEIVAGLLVAFRPQFAYIVSAWLLGIILNLLIKGEYFDVAFRDFGLAVGAFALARQAQGWRRLSSDRQ